LLKTCLKPVLSTYGTSATSQRQVRQVGAVFMQVRQINFLVGNIFHFFSAENLLVTLSPTRQK